MARLFDAVIEVLGRASEDRPARAGLEDLHWADGSTRDLIRLLVRNMRVANGLVIVATYRSDDLHRRHPLMTAPRPSSTEPKRVERIELDRLRSRRAPRAARRRSSATPSDPSVVDALLERSDGLAVLRRGARRRAGGTGAELPSTLRDILGSRLATLSPRARSVVRPRRSSGGRFPHDRLAAASGEDEDALMAAASTRPSMPGSCRACRRRRRPRVRVPPCPPPRGGLRGSSSRPSASGCTRASSIICRSAAETGSRPDPSVVAEYALHAYQAHDQPRALVGSVRALEALAAAAAYREALGHAERAIELWPRVDDARGAAGIAYVDLLALAARIAVGDEPARACDGAAPGGAARGPDRHGPGAPRRPPGDPARDRMGSGRLRCQRGRGRGGLRAGRARGPPAGRRRSRF